MLCVSGEGAACGAVSISSSACNSMPINLTAVPAALHPWMTAIQQRWLQLLQHVFYASLLGVLASWCYKADRVLQRHRNLSIKSNQAWYLSAERKTSKAKNARQKNSSSPSQGPLVRVCLLLKLPKHSVTSREDLLILTPCSILHPSHPGLPALQVATCSGLHRGKQHRCTAYHFYLTFICSVGHVPTRPAPLPSAAGLKLLRDVFH